jgi:feruloyl-CoA synthase
MKEIYREVDFGPNETYIDRLASGVIHYGSKDPLLAFPEKITDKLAYWAEHTPNHVFLGIRNASDWQTLTYQEVWDKTTTVASYLLDMNFTKEDAIVILSENSLEHAILALAALHLGIVYSPISPAYSMVLDDLSKLKHCVELMTPKLVFAQNGKSYKKALNLCKELFNEVTIVTANGDMGLGFDKLLNAKNNKEAVAKIAKKVTSDTLAKVIFTSGSTGFPKGVKNHQEMLCANLQQISQVFPFMQKKPPVFVDWLPWNHTFGGNHNFGMTLYNGGSLYIDNGKPSEKDILQTVQNLKDISPTAYFNVPKGFEMLIPYLENDEQLRHKFFKNLQMLFYAGASLAQPIWDKLEELSMMTIGKKVPIISGFGSTESGPSAMFANWTGAFSGLLGIPVPGLDVKLLPDGDKIQACYKAPNITKGYYRNLEATKQVFDQDGYFLTGDAVKFLDENNPNKGLLFDGRLAEDFKLSTGTWVSVGVIIAKVLKTGSPLIKDVALTGLNEDFIGAILFLNKEVALSLTKLPVNTSLEEISNHAAVSVHLEKWLTVFNSTSTGSSTCIKKYVIATDEPSIDLGEITDKGSINQIAVLSHRKKLVASIYEKK